MYLRRLLLVVAFFVIFTDFRLSVSITPSMPWAAPLDYYLPTPPQSDTIAGVSIRDVVVDSTLSLTWSRVYQVRRMTPVTENTWDYTTVFYLDQSGNKLTVGAVQVFVPIDNTNAK